MANGLKATNVENAKGELSMPNCPICGMIDDRVSVAIHLMNAHGYSFQKASDWLRVLIESR